MSFNCRIRAVIAAGLLALLAVNPCARWYSSYKPIKDCIMPSRNGRHKRQTATEDMELCLLMVAADPAFGDALLSTAAAGVGKP